MLPHVLPVATLLRPRARPALSATALSAVLAACMSAPLPDSTPEAVSEPAAEPRAAEIPDPASAAGADAAALLDRAAATHGLDTYRRLGTLRIREEGTSLWVGQGANPADPTRHRAVIRETSVDFGEERFRQRYRSFTDGGEPASCSVTVATEATAFRHDCLNDVVSFRSGTNGASALAGWEAARPVGWIDAARDAADSAEVRRGPEGTLVLTFPRGRRSRTLHFEGGSGLLRRVEATLPGDLGRDVVQVLEFDDYRDMGGYLLPFHVGFANPGGYGLDLRITEQRADATLPDSLFAPPAGATLVEAPESSPEPTTERPAPGVLLVRDVVPDYNALVVDTGEGLAVFDAPGGEEAARRILGAAQEAFPAGTLRWVVPTHFHHDHVAGLPSLVAAGARVLTSPGNVAFLRELVGDASPERGRGDGPAVEAVRDRWVLGRGPGRVVLQSTHGRPHVDEMILPWLPGPRILYQADLFWTGGPLRPLQAEAARLLDILGERGLEPRLVASAHWGSGSLREVREAVGSGREKQGSRAPVDMGS